MCRKNQKETKREKRRKKTSRENQTRKHRDDDFSHKKQTRRVFSRVFSSRPFEANGRKRPKYCRKNQTPPEKIKRPPPGTLRSHLAARVVCEENFPSGGRSWCATHVRGTRRGNRAARVACGGNFSSGGRRWERARYTGDAEKFFKKQTETGRARPMCGER